MPTIGTHHPQSPKTCSVYVYFGAWVSGFLCILWPDDVLVILSLDAQGHLCSICPLLGLLNASGRLRDYSWFANLPRALLF